MSDVALENTLFLNKPFYQVYFVLGVYIFFLLLYYQIIATEKTLKFVLKIRYMRSGSGALSTRGIYLIKEHNCDLIPY